MDAVRPRRLRKGQLIGLVSPAGTPSPGTKIEKSVRRLESEGYRVVVGKHAAAEHGYLAGRDEERAADLNAMIRDPAVRAIFALRGGYGSPRLLRWIDYGALGRDPKIICGFSDITALQLAIFRKCRLVTFSGPMPAVDFWDEIDSYTEENFWRLLTSTRKIGPLENPPHSPATVLRTGVGQGTLLGGNLSLLVSSLGTPFLPSLRGAILVLEEVDEYPYRIDRMLTQLENSGIARAVNGVVFGQFTRCVPKDPSKPSLPVEVVQKDFVSRLNCPVFGNLQYGHVPCKLTLPLGLEARLDSAQNCIELPQSAVI